MQVIVLVMHGAVPKDFPLEEKKEYFRLHSQMGTPGSDPEGRLKKKHDELEEKMRRWPRTKENDPFCDASCELASALQKECGQTVRVCFNEFCAPSVEEAIDQSVELGAKEIIVATPMLTRGGYHAETEIPQIVETARQKHSGIKMTYAWPFGPEKIARFLSEQINRTLSGGETLERDKSSQGPIREK